MNLVIKNTNETAPEGAEKLYLDRRVNKGTLYGIEFSNRGALIDFDLSKGITDLAEGVAAREGYINTLAEVPTEDAPLPQITDKRGMPMKRTTINPRRTENGIRIHGVGRYLYEKQPSFLKIIWLEMDMNIAENIGGGRIIELAGTALGSLEGFIGVTCPSVVNPQISFQIGGKSSFTNINIGDKTVAQLAVEFTGDGTPNNCYLNGVFHSTGSASEGGFGEPSVEDILSITGISPTTATFGQPAILYATFGHDLTLAGKTAAEIVAEDFDYVNGLGEFANMEGVKRPYANVM